MPNSNPTKKKTTTKTRNVTKWSHVTHQQRLGTRKREGGEINNKFHYKVLFIVCFCGSRSHLLFAIIIYAKYCF